MGSKCQRKRGKKTVVPYRNVIMRQPQLQQQVSRAYHSVLDISLNDEKRLQSYAALSVLHYIDRSPHLRYSTKADVLCARVWSGLNYICEAQLFNDVRTHWLLLTILQRYKLILSLFYSLKLTLRVIVSLSRRENRAQLKVTLFLGM